MSRLTSLSGPDARTIRWGSEVGRVWQKDSAPSMLTNSAPSAVREDPSSCCSENWEQSMSKYCSYSQAACEWGGGGGGGKGERGGEGGKR